MYTPKQLRRLGELLSEESLGHLPSLEDFVVQSLAEKVIVLGPCVRISRAGKLEVFPPDEKKQSSGDFEALLEEGEPRGSRSRVFARRLQARALVRFLVRAAGEGLEVGQFSQNWLSRVLRARDMFAEAQDAYRLASGDRQSFESRFVF